MKPLFLLLLVAATSLIAADPTPEATNPKAIKLLPQVPDGFTFQVIEVAKYPEHTVELFVYVPQGAGLGLVSSVSMEVVGSIVTSTVISR